MSVSRRHFLAVTGVGVASVAGCVGDGANSTGVLENPAFGYGGAPVVKREMSAASGGDGSRADSVLGGAGSLATAESEPNDHRDDATVVGTDTAVTGTLSGSEVDWFAFDAGADTGLTVWFEKSAADGVVAVVCYGPEGDFVDQVYVGTTTPSKLDVETVEAGRHFVQVVNVQDGGGEYVITVGTGTESTPTQTPTPTETPTPTPTETPTPTPTEVADYGIQGYGEYGYGGVEQGVS